MQTLGTFDTIVINELNILNGTHDRFLPLLKRRAPSRRKRQLFLPRMSAEKQTVCFAPEELD